MNTKKLKFTHLAYVILVSCLLASHCSHSENLFNAFVLETSDPDPPAPLALVSNQNHSTNYAAHPDKSLDDSNTKIITDDQIVGTSISQPTNNGNQQNKNNNLQLAPQQHKQQEQVGRKLDNDESTEARLHNERNKQYATRNTSQQHSSTNRPKQTLSSSTTAGYEQNGPAKTEERLLISITSNDGDDEDQLHKPVRNPQSSSSSSSSSIGVSGDENGPTHSLQQHQHQKRKPQITISIQDANINKQNPGSGASAVIVRPGDDGQSIVIATVNTQSNKYKPQQVELPLPPQTSGSNVNYNNNNLPPYREPVNNPLQSILNQHQVTSTTKRPIYQNNNNEFSSSNRPLISGGSFEGERPVRPVPIATADDYERPSRRPDYLEPNLDTSSTNQQLDGSSSQQLTSHSQYELNERNCGLIHETKIVGGEEANPDDFMWMAAIVKSRPKDGQARPFCGGSLITRRHILTAAHCLEGLAPRDVLVRLGSYDFDDSTASSLSADYAIDQFRVPAQYSKKTHVADIAIMRLKTPLSTSDNYKTVCMPQPRRSYVGALGTVTGYGSQSQTFRRAAAKLRQVTVPIWENRKCSTVYKKNLTESFLCAGYEEGGKDACQGDSGGPLMTEGPEQKMMVVGVVSHGIGCGAPGYPGVYTRTTTFIDWIEKNTRE